jgi:hypothetical protein
MFVNLSREAFSPRRTVSLPIISGIQRGVVSYFKDSLYPEKGLERALKHALTDNLKMLDCAYDKEIGAKILITAMTIQLCEPCLFTNYQGAGRPMNCGKRMCLISTVKLTQ